MFSWVQQVVEVLCCLMHTEQTQHVGVHLQGQQSQVQPRVEYSSMSGVVKVQCRLMHPEWREQQLMQHTQHYQQQYQHHCCKQHAAHNAAVAEPKIAPGPTCSYPVSKDRVPGPTCNYHYHLSNIPATHLHNVGVVDAGAQRRLHHSHLLTPPCCPPLP